MCKGCYLHAVAATAKSPREKYIFLVRHAQSTWNQKVDVMKSIGRFSMDMSLTQVVSRTTQLMTCDVWHRDHPISEEGVHQTTVLRQKISETRGVERRQTDREQGYYRRFLEHRRGIYSSPLLRALQTAHLALPEEEWGGIKLLKDARERFTFVFERDCLGTDVGPRIVGRALRMGHDMRGLPERVDASDCIEKWWSDDPETEADMESRLDSLWRQLCEDDDKSCVLVTHSNLIKALLMRHGDLDVTNSSATARPDVCMEAESMSETAAAGLSRSEDPDVVWQVVSGGSESLRRLKVDRLQNCGVLGLRCVEAQSDELHLGPFREVDGWIDLDPASGAVNNAVTDSRWVAKDALLMFESVLVR